MFIDRYFNSAMDKVSVESLITWAILAVTVGVFMFFLWHKGKISDISAILIPLFTFYLCFTLSITIFERYNGGQSRYIFELFWSYKAIIGGKTDLIAEVVWNVVLFVPIGGIVAGIIRNHSWVAIPFGFLLSLFIELFQLLSHRGLFELDDIFHNTVGTAAGMVLYLLVVRMFRRISN